MISTFLKKLWWDVNIRGLSSCPVYSLLAIFIFWHKDIRSISWHNTHGIHSGDTWSHRTPLTVLAHTDCIVLGSSQLGQAHRGIFCRETRCIPLRLRCTENPGAFPSAHIHIHSHKAKTIPVVCHTKQLQSATREIKKREANLAQLESIPSGQQRKTKVKKNQAGLNLSAWLACWTTHKGTQGIDQRRRPLQEWPEGRRNLLLCSQICFWGDKQSKDESML